MSGSAVSIVGPTGVGKTGLALELAENRGEIISVDSRQIYTFMDIGTAKPTPTEQKRVPHHMVDIVTPDVRFSAGEFVRQAAVSLNTIWKHKKIPFLVGGTGLYFNALMYGLAPVPEVDNDIRQRLQEKLENKGPEYLYRILQRVDPEYAAKTPAANKQRIQRALEVYFSSGKSFSAYHKEKHSIIECDFIKICINRDRKELYERINKRVDIMLNGGLVAEVESLLARGFKKDDPGMLSIGYKEIVAFLDGKCTLDEASDKIKQNSRRYAKRQLTWFRAMPDLKWFENSSAEEVGHYLDQKLHQN